MYEGDSFHTLTMPGQIGLIILSLLLSAAMLGLAWRMMRGRSIALRLAIAAGVFVAFLWLSPQVYYAYYQVLFDGLPWQIVVKQAPSPAALWSLMSFSGPATLSAHGQAALGWALVALALLRRRAASAARSNDRA